MLLASNKLSVVHVTTHVSLKGATQRATLERVLGTIRAGNEHFKALGYASPRMAVAGMNPHCGEGGIFGNEEIDNINPAVAQAQKEGINVKGPISGDTVFYRTLKGEFDLVVAQYHDQGHIPTKLIAFDETVNVSLGLPIRRTSVDHGTAYDIAWKGQASLRQHACGCCLCPHDGGPCCLPRRCLTYYCVPLTAEAQRRGGAQRTFV